MMQTVLPQALMDQVFLGLEFLVLATARPFGLSLFFTIFAWAHLNSGVLRMVFAIAIALPIVSWQLQASGGVHPDLPYPYVLVLIKELGFGALIGWILSLPFAMAAGGGHIIDSYRGGLTGDTDPSGGQITPYAKLFTLVAILVFAVLDGFWILADTIYATYGFWPIFDATPFAGPFRIEPIFELIASLMRGALVVSAPLLVIMFVIDIVFLFAAKFGKQINVTHLSFSVKNSVALVLLPLFILVLLRVLEGNVVSLGETEGILRRLWP